MRTQDMQKLRRISLERLRKHSESNVPAPCRTWIAKIGERWYWGSELPQHRQ